MSGKEFELVVSVAGVIERSNFAEYKKNVLAILEQVNIQPGTDQEFAEAEELVKKFKRIEAAIDDARARAMDNVADVQQLFRDMTEVADKVKDVRLALARSIKQEKERKKSMIVAEAVNELRLFIMELERTNDVLQGKFSVTSDDFSEAGKSKKKIETFQKTIAERVDELKESIKEKTAIYLENHRKILEVNMPTLFPDKKRLITKARAEVDAIIKERLATHELEEQRRAAAKEAEKRRRLAAEAKELQEHKQQGRHRTVNILDEQQVQCEITSVAKNKHETGHSRAPKTEKVRHGQPAVTGPVVPTESFVMTVIFEGAKEVVAAIAVEVDSVVSKYDEVVSIDLSRHDQ